MRRSKKYLAVLAALGTGYLAGRYIKHHSKERISGPRYLIINADDFGLSDGVTEGIIKAWREGMVTSTSAMVNIEGAPQRIATAHQSYPTLPIGLHLNVTAGRPVLPPEQVPTLVDERGYFHDRFTVFQHLPHISLAELRAELNAQAELLLATGVEFDHIDYHQHLMVTHTPFYPLVTEMACKYGVPVRQPVPEYIYGQVRVKGASNGAVWQTALKFATQYPNLAVRLVPTFIPSTYKRQAAFLQAQGVKTTNWLIVSLYDKASVENLVSVIRQLPPGVSELVMHPGFVDEQLGALGGNYIQQRRHELAMLINPRVQDALREYNVTPVDFSFVAARSGDG